MYYVESLQNALHEENGDIIEGENRLVLRLESGHEAEWVSTRTSQTVQGNFLSNNRVDPSSKEVFDDNRE